MTTNIAIAREQRIFAVKEGTRGTLAFPATDGSAQEIIAAGYGSMNQQPSFTNSEEIKNTRDVTDRFVDQKPAGEWSFPLYARPSGSKGTEPMGDVLFECFFGSKTVNASTSVVYSQALTKPSFSLWMKRGHTVFFAKGCTVNQLSPSISTSGGVQLSPSGQFMEMGWVGTDTVSSDTSADDTVTVNNPKRFSIGGRIQNTTAGDDNEGDGYEITGVDYTTGEITLGTSLSATWSSDDVIEPFLPSGTVVGEPLEARKSTVDIGSETGKLLQSLDLTLNDPVNFIQEISTNQHPEDYIEEERDLTGTLGLYFRKKDLAYFYEGYNGNRVALAVHCGDTDGKKLDIEMDHTSLEVPSVETNAPAVNLSIGLMGLGDTGEDSLRFVFK
jgi:hypothetical protein